MSHIPIDSPYGFKVTQKQFMEKSLLAKQIVEICHLKGRFTLRSGQISDEYFDKYRLEALPQLLESIALFMIPLIPKETELLAGLEMGGIPLVTALSLKTGKPTRFIRKEAKTYGTRQIAEGGDIQGKTLCLIEDVITTGGQALLSAKALREAGAQICAVLCVIYRGNNLADLEKQGLKVIPLFSKEELIS